MVLLRCCNVGIAALAGIVLSAGLQGCEHIENGVKSLVEVTCKTRLDSILNDIESKYEDVLNNLCEKVQNTTEDTGVDVSAALQKCLDDGTSKIDEETKAERDNMTAQCIKEFTNFTDFSGIKDKVDKYIADNKPDVDLTGRLEGVLGDLKEEAQKAINKTKDSLNDGLDSVHDKLDDDENTTRLFAALRIPAMGSSSAASVSLFGAALVALAGLLALVRRGASRQVGDAEQHEMLAPGEESDI